MLLWLNEKKWDSSLIPTAQHLEESEEQRLLWQHINVHGFGITIKGLSCNESGKIANDTNKA